MTCVKTIFAAYAVGAAFLMYSCASSPEIAENATVMEIVQKGQEATDRDRYRLAVYYYGTILERFPYDISAVCGAEYEIAFIHYKQKKYSTAKAEFQALLSRYEQEDSELLPQEYKILGNIVLKKIDTALKEFN
jgi:outer membrane protein assembly factor BamD (BamD/ComL family)